ETAMMQTFMDKGFEVVDPATVRANIKRAQALAALEGDNKAAAAIGQSFEAEVVITGKAIAKVASTQLKVLGDMKSCQANVTARVVKTDVGTVIATGSQHAPAVHIDEITGGTQAIEKASKKLAEELIEKILKKWREEFYTMTTVKLQLTGVQSPSQLNDFKGVLKYYIRGIKDVYQRNVAGGAAELDVKITGNADQLARELERKDLGKFKVQIGGISPNRINLKLMEKQAVEPALEDTTGMN
ncbi:MAG: hypothetical protein ONB05_11990, partial [candidate division KSB1 bacterium]|nr:hypothetical protein [candidate division KSB1 bacterium]